MPDPEHFPPGQDHEQQVVHQLRRIADAQEKIVAEFSALNKCIEDTNEEVFELLEEVLKELQCICKALQAPTAQSATLTIDRLVKKEK